MKNYLRKNYSQDDLRKLINESQKINSLINRIINKDIYFNMVSESNRPLREKENYIKKCYRIKNYYPIYNNSRYYLNDNKKINNNQINRSYIDNRNNYNKYLFGEKKHFPDLTNKSCLKILNHHLIPTTERLKLIKRDDNNFENDKNNEIYSNRANDSCLRKYNFFNGSGIRSYNYGKINSLRNNQRNIRKKILKMQPITEDVDYSKRYNLNHNSINYPNESQYYPRRCNYVKKRFDDESYNLYSNRSMIGDIRNDNEKFPPLYNYNQKIYY